MNKDSAFQKTLKPRTKLASFSILKKNLLQPQSGFTLIELLVVIAVMLILIGLAASSYTTAQKKARDSQRKSDLKTVQSALEQYYADNLAYPAVSGTAMSCNGSAAWGGVFSCDNGNGSKIYLGKIPDDPLAPSRHYTYKCNRTVGTGCQEFSLWAQLENSNDPDKYNAAGTDQICNTSGAPGGGSWVCYHK